MVRSVEQRDYQAITDIYNYYISDSIITFEEEIIDIREMKTRILEVTDQMPWLVYQSADHIEGFAYASPWKGRCAYRHSAECTVYVREGRYGQGFGSKLYQNLIGKMQTLGYHVLIGGIALPNAPSVALHEKMNFVKVAHFSEVGYKFNRWIDVGYWQLTLDLWGVPEERT